MMPRSTDTFDNGIVDDCARCAAQARRGAWFVVGDAEVPTRGTPPMPPGMEGPYAMSEEAAPMSGRTDLPLTVRRR